MHRTDKSSQHSSIIWPVWENGWVFIYELSGCGFVSSCGHLNLRFCTCFEQRVPWHSGNYRVWIRSEACMWHDKNIQSSLIFRNQNPDTFMTRDILRTLSRQILAYLERCLMLTCWEPCHIYNFFILRTLAYFRPQIYPELWQTCKMEEIS